MPRSKDTAAIVTYGDHEIITPEATLRGAISRTSGQSGDDPVARAEKALADLSNQFASWMDAESDRCSTRPVATLRKISMRRARTPSSTPPTTSRAKQGLSAFRPLRPQSLCRLIDHTPD